ncbi:hypothetical protein Hhel01_03644 [Haloferula helveola]
MESVRDIYLSALDAGERESISQLAVDLLTQDTAAPALSWIAEADGIAVGHIAFSPVTVKGSAERIGFILAPLAVRPSHQKRGIGSELIRRGIDRLSEAGPDILLVYGDPGYYGRFGFDTSSAESYIPPYPLTYPFGWQARPLGDWTPPASALRIECAAPLNEPALW